MISDNTVRKYDEKMKTELQKLTIYSYDDMFRLYGFIRYFRINC